MWHRFVFVFGLLLGFASQALGDDGCSDRFRERPAVKLSPASEHDIKQVSGVYQKDETGSFTRRDPKEIDESAQYLIVSDPIPLLAPEQGPGEGDVFEKFVSSGESRRRIKLRDLLKAAYSILPQWRDVARPTKDEVKAAAQKVLIPGMLTATVMTQLGQPLEVMIPITLVNATNSFTIGSFRTTIGNWWRRSQTSSSLWMKSLLMTGFFTTTLYWAAQGSLDGVAAAALTGAGWLTMLQKKTFSALAQVAWRKPTHELIFRWEGRKFKRQDPLISREARRAGGSLEKYMSYVMTQFYLYSIVSQQTLFQLVYGKEGGLYLTGNETLPEGATALLNGNAAHVAMAGIAVTATTLFYNQKLVDRLAVWALKMDNLEDAFLRALTWPVRAPFKYYRRKKNHDS